MKNTFKLLPIAAAVATLTACGGSSSNSVPEFSQSSYTLTVQEDASGKLTASATDANGSDVLSYSLSNAPANGTVEVAANGELTYTPDANFNGQDAFTVSVSDGKANANAQVTVTVENVNDAPTIGSEKLVLTGGETKTTTVDAQDIDGDTLTYSVVTEPTKGTLVLDSTTGAITYTPNELSVVNDSVEIKVVDGNGGEVTETLAISSSAASNADRAYYYYADSSSRLQRAETTVTALEDDLNQGDVFGALASGYASAGLSKEVARLSTDEKIVRDEQRASAYVDIANNYQGQTDKQEKAAELRDDALALYGSYVAAKGVSSFNGDDVIFYNDLSSSFLVAGATDKANSAFGVLDVLFEDGADEAYSTSVLRTFFGYRSIIEEAVIAWENNPTDENFTNTLSHIDRMHKYSNQIGYRVVSNDRNGNKGEKYFSIRVAALQYVTEYYRALGETVKAKEALADALALYNVVNYDDAFSKTANPQSTITAIEYPSGIEGLADDFIELYPNLPITTLTNSPVTDDNKEDIIEEADQARLLAAIANAATKEDAMALLNAAKDEDNLRSHFTAMVAFSQRSTKGAALIYKQKQQYDDAIYMLSEGAKVLGSDAYIAQEKKVEILVTGGTGCEMVLEEYQSIISRTQSQAHIDSMKASFEICSNIALTSYNEADLAAEVDDSETVWSQANMLRFAIYLDDQDAIAKHVALIESQALKVEEGTARMSVYAAAARAYFLNNDFDKAQEMYSRVLSLLRSIETNSAEEDKGAETVKFFSNSPDTSYLVFINTIRLQLGVNPEAATAFNTATKTWQDFINVNMTDLADSATQFKLNMLPKYASQLNRLGLFDASFKIAENEVFSDVEKDAVNSSAAAAMSIWDDFPRTNVANVDTDKDGKPNFFAAFATQAMIDGSGLTLDEDSDNDGANDDVDGFPLDSTKQ